MSEEIGLGDGCADVQCAVEGEEIAFAVSATTVQRQCVRVGAADVVDRRSVVANSEAADVTSILAYVRVVLCRKSRTNLWYRYGKRCGCREVADVRVIIERDGRCKGPNGRLI